MRRLLIVAFDFPPRGATGALRVTKFARYLPDYGWQPVVVCAAPDAATRDESLLAQLPPDLEVIRVPYRRVRGRHTPAVAAVTPLRPSRLRRLLVPDPQVLWLPRIVRAATARLCQGDIDALMTTSPPHSLQLGGLWLKRRFPALPWLVDLRDVWSDSAAYHSLAAYKLNRALERECLLHADHVVVVTDGMRKLVLGLGLPPHRVSLITNGFDASDLPPIQPHARGRRMRLTFVGTMVAGRVSAAHGFFMALQQLSVQGTAGDLEVRLIGSFAAEIHALAEPLVRAGIVTFAGFVPHATAIAEMASADVLLLLDADDHEGRIVHSNKLFEYFAVGRPLLALSPEGEIARLVREAGVGVVIQPRAVAEIATALRDLLAQWKQRTLPVYGQNDPRFARFERRVLTAELARLLDRMAGRTAERSLPSTGGSR